MAATAWSSTTRSCRRPPRRRAGRLATLLLLAVAALAAAAPAASASVAGPLGHAGRWITDGQGRVVVLHGLNMVYKRPPYTPEAAGFGDDDAAFLAAAGFDTVRVGIIYAAVEPAPGVYDDAYLDSIARTVATLARHGIVSVLDAHQDLYSERFQGEGFPDWAVLDDGLPAQPQRGFPANYLVMPALQHAFDHLWNDDPGPGGVGLADRLAAAWAHVAARFRGLPGVLGYELLNEPWPGTVWAPCGAPAGCPAFDAKLGAFDRRVVAAIRGADPRTLVLYEPNVRFNTGSATHVGGVGDAHAVFAFHDYCMQAGRPGSRSTCASADDLVFANAERQSRRTSDGLLLTEFGATRDRTVLGDMLARADRTMIGWQEWHYCGCDDPTTSGPGSEQALVLDPHRPPSGANVETAKLALLARAYPRAVAGTPLRWTFDASSRRFTLTFDPRRTGAARGLRPGARTEIVLPALQYPHGYRARVSGGRVTSAAGATVLRIATRAGARRVSVDVAPRAG